MKLYCAIDLHSTNNVIVVIDESDKILFQKRLPNDLQLLLTVLAPFKADLHGIAIESTFNWYWLVDGLLEADYSVMLENGTDLFCMFKFSQPRIDSGDITKLISAAILIRHEPEVV